MRPTVGEVVMYTNHSNHKGLQKALIGKTQKNLGLKRLEKVTQGDLSIQQS